MEERGSIGRGPGRALWEGSACPLSNERPGLQSIFAPVLSVCHQPRRRRSGELADANFYRELLASSSLGSFLLEYSVEHSVQTS